jgi:hypothetical protein
MGCVFLAALACGSAHAGADGDMGDSRFSLGGFGTLGIVRSTGGEGLLRDISQPKGISRHWSARTDSVFGLQASYRMSDSFDAVVQGASFMRYDGSYRPKLTWAFLKYEVTPRFSLRLGRVSTDFLISANSRRIGYSHVPVRPPFDFYGINAFASADGIDANLRWPAGDGILRLEAFTGLANEDVPLMELKGSRLWRGMIGYDLGPWQFSYIHSRLRLTGSIPSMKPLHDALEQLGATPASNALAIEGAISYYRSLGTTYDDGNWQALAAVSHTTHRALMLESIRGATFRIARKFGDFRPFIAYTWAKSSGKSFDSGLPNPAFAPLNDAIMQAMASSHLHRQTRTLGVRWDFARNMDLKAQIDFIHGSKSSVLLSEDRVFQGDSRMKIFSLSLDFIF